MSKNGKIDYPLDKGDREDVRWFENYEKCGKTKHLERLKKKDILNYIRDVEQNCRLEVSSGDEDYAGTRKSSDCSVIRCSGVFRRIDLQWTKRILSGDKSLPVATFISIADSQFLDGNQNMQKLFLKSIILNKIRKRWID
ncbi:PREDICTED: uncharacterized protein LOC105458636 isoform X2 [Wasmannia auropunctata]|uniref:uncharacterized protein LOC105458636 isoform X2 n=1 Tax=Wasmannia auropunctata TaxID=64793 RepID=UPI0005ED8771|nr:PREDICTED: uncharacterized protein LOC105458636 isoform X2 [Wasmannia auropunctata]